MAMVGSQVPVNARCNRYARYVKPLWCTILSDLSPLSTDTGMKWQMQRANLNVTLTRQV